MLALIAGRGDLPTAVANALPTRPLVCAVESSPPQDLTPDLTFRAETIGTLIATLVDRGVTTLCMCGSIDRPSVDPALVDSATRPIAARLAATLAKRDDGALRGIVSLFEEVGIKVLGAHELVPDLLPQAGVLTRTGLPAGIEADVAAAEAALSEMGRVDLGQACVVGGGQVIAREDDSGTDAMLERLGASDGSGAFLFKAPKPGQDRRADLPTIGPKTATGAVRAGLAGIVIEAGGVMVLDRDSVVRILDAQGMFLWVRGP